MINVNDKRGDILWDTGPGISIISKKFGNDLFPSVVTKNFHDILSNADKLDGVIKKFYHMKAT